MGCGNQSTPPISVSQTSGASLSSPRQFFFHLVSRIQSRFTASAALTIPNTKSTLITSFVLWISYLPQMSIPQQGEFRRPSYAGC